MDDADTGLAGDTVSFTINGELRSVEATCDDILLDVLRRLGMSSVREGCAVGMCGSCTVLVSGTPRSSCLVLAPQAEDWDVTTVEGLLADDGTLHEVQEAFLRHTAFQCSFCTPGFVLSTLALMREHEQPSDEQIRHYLAGNLCRCGSYSKIFDAVKDVLDGRAVGRSATDDPAGTTTAASERRTEDA